VLFKYIITLSLLFSLIQTKAQLCNGSLGDPVVNITFGNGNGNNGGFVATASYNFASPCPNDGFYTITTASSGCFNNSWHTVSSDHTGNNGAFMIVNATFTPGDFVFTTIKDLCPNTNYEFAAWLLNIMKNPGISPNITFTIETPSGIILQSYNTGDIPNTSQPTWKQYGFYFTTQANNPVIVLRMKNNAPGGLGNDIAMDDITFRPCGPSINAAIINNSDTVNICEGNTNTYQFNSNIGTGYNLPVYQWQVSTDSGKNWKDIVGENKTSLTRIPTTPGFYWYRQSVSEQT
jgi:hypothetical protein